MKLIPGGRHGAEPSLARSAGAYSEQSASVLAGILESADELFAAIDADYRFVAFNAAFRREFTTALGQAPTLGEPLALGGVAGQQAAAELGRRAFGGEALQIEQELAAPGVLPKLYQVTLSPILNTEGQTVVVAIVARDITDKREAERKFLQLLDASPDALLIIKGDAIAYINAQAEAMFGYAHQALVGQPLETLVPQRLRAQHLRDRAAYEKSPMTRAMGSGLSLSGVRADGTEFPVEISLNPLQVAGETLFAAAIRDMSARKQADDDLRQQNAALTAQVIEQAAQLKASLQAAEQYRAGFDDAAIGIAITTPDGRLTRVNAAYCAITGHPAEKLLQLSIRDITHADDLDVDAHLDTRLLSGELDNYTIEKRIVRGDGRVMWSTLTVSARRDAKDKVAYLVAVLHDISRRKAVEKRLAETQRRLQAAVGIARLGFWERTPVTDEVYFSPEWKAQIGYAEHELPNTLQEWSARLHPDDRVRIVETIQKFVERPQGELQFEYRFRHRDGKYRWFSSRAIALEDPPGATCKIIGIRADITERKETEQRIREAGKHDPLTGLPNRGLLFEYAEHLFAAAHRNGAAGAIMFIDLDRFKEINDTHGHEIGDEVLREVAKRLSSAIRKGDIAGRLGGDEFLVILPHVPKEFSIASVADHVLARLNLPYRVGGLELSTPPSIGVAMFPDNGGDLDTLIRHADHAMYAAKETGGSRVQFFTPELARRADQARVLERRLKAAVEHGEFELQFQAIADVATARVIGAEALLRWRRDCGELVPPDEFVPLAEATGLMGRLGEWVIDAVCAQLRQWRQLGMAPLPVSINISPVQFRHKDFAAVLDQLIRAGGVDPALVRIDLSESTVMQDVERSIEVLRQVRNLGVKIALDHFGSGYTHLGSLSHLPLDTLKIDPAFGRALDRDPHCAAVIDASIALGKTLELEIVGGGIESESALTYLRDHDCAFAQGFYLGRPMQAREFQRWVREHAG